MFSSLARRALSAGALTLGAGLTALVLAAPAAADSDVGRVDGGPLVEAEPSAPVRLDPPAGPDLGTTPATPDPDPDPDPDPAGDEDFVLPCPVDVCGPEDPGEEPPLDGCTVEDPCGPEDEWTELDSGCFVYNGDYGWVYCPGEEHPQEVDEDGCYLKNDHVYCLPDGDDPGGPGDPGDPGPCEPGECPDDSVNPSPDCPLTHVSDDCRPDDAPGDEPGDTPGDEPGTPPAHEGGPGLPVTGPGLALLAGAGAVLVAVGGGGLLLARRREQRGGDPLA
ncbi:hypothetical protein [Actinorugispora endophytica]|uniref:LPXTG-motif cell wall-anchored protein n=1 Tax=Actinorugispora endophytica TaxID=1605990 RepID=A0A4R6V717_9ACTN|nr:hypothetical protein [Actinorugispora endophytica]TDQ54896.1 hypothetical protein EV190_101215 [Actinorugispora endophytica]